MSLSLLLPVLLACGGGAPPHQEPDRTAPPRQDELLFFDNTVDLEQGWTEQDEAGFAFTDEGGRWVRYDWFLALEQPGSEELFRSNQNLMRFRLVPAAKSPQNPDGLPVGVTKNTDQASGLSYMGINCAACHNSYLKVGDKVIQVDGGASLFNINGYMAGVAEALDANLKDEAKFDRFAARVLGDKAKDPAALGELRGGVEVARDGLQLRIQYATPEAAAGASYGRLDAFGFVMNELSAVRLGIPENAHPSTAPASYPFLWTTPQQSLVEWPATSSNKLPAGLGPLIRNATQSLGAMAFIDFKPGDGLGYDSSLNFEGLGAQEAWVVTLHPPAWPAELLGALDAEKVAAGAVLYQANCVSCHGLYDASMEQGGFKVGQTPVGEVGTDRTLLDNLNGYMGSTGPLQGTKDLVVAGDKFGPTAKSLDIAVSGVVGTLLKHPAEVVRAGLDAVTKTPAERSGDDVYKAGPLVGVWASAPFLHNGSVPTLAALLSPPAARPATWYQGTYEYDSVAIGYKTEQSDTNDFLYDTSKIGNSNSGHLYGTALSDDEKAQILEYIKSL